MSDQHSDGVDQWALQAVEPMPPAHGFMRRHFEADECVFCDADPDPFPADSIPVQTPDGRVWLRLSDDPSCLECRKDVVRKLSHRGQKQEGLDAFA